MLNSPLGRGKALATLSLKQAGPFLKEARSILAQVSVRSNSPKPLAAAKRASSTSLTR